MGIFTDDQYMLPGVITEIESDYSLGYDTSEFGNTDSVLLIGTAFDGPTGVPVAIYTPEYGQYIFGKTFNNATKKEATLTAAIKDTYDSGCRTIYGLRVNGEIAYKDFSFNIETNMRLRISGRYASNITKECYLVIDNTLGDETVKIYKPAEKATINEKMQGLVVSDNAILINEFKINRDLGLTRDSKISELIKVVNEHEYNNVLKLSIVNLDGLDVTGSIEAYDLQIGALYSGIYFVGRDTSICDCLTETKYALVLNDTDTVPFSDFDDLYYKIIEINTDVSLDIPIYAKNIKDIRDVLKKVGISNAKKYDFLETAGICDAAFPKNDYDYEQVDMTTFELYQKLGSGFATTARAVLRTDSVTGKEITPKVKETPVSDPNRVVSIVDGYYSILEDVQVDYKVLTCGNLEDSIIDKIPRASAFKISVPKEFSILDGYVKVTPVVEKDDFTLSKAYEMVIDKITTFSSDKIEDVYTDKIVTCVGKVTDKTTLEKNIADGKIPNNTYFMLVNETKDDVTGVITAREGTLIKVENGRIKELHMSTLDDDLYMAGDVVYYGTYNSTDSKIVFSPVTIVPADPANNIGPTYANKEYFLIDNNNKLYVTLICDPTDASTQDMYCSPLGLFRSMFSGNEDKTNCYAQNNYYDVNKVNVTSAILNSTTLEEFVEMLNSENYLGKLFSFKIDENHLEEKDEYMIDIPSVYAALGTKYTLTEDREFTYDYNLYIPYKSTDNFARQLAQHCTYSEIKAGACKGFIGCRPLLDTGLESIAAKVTNLVESSVDLYAKHENGRNMLDRNNMPYPVGRNINVPIVQYAINTIEGYTYISNGAAGYAGMVSALPLDQSSTNQKIKIPTPSYTFSAYQLKKLTQKGFVTIKNSYTKGYVVTDGITMAPSSSSFRRLSVARITGEVENLIRTATEVYLGKQNTLVNINSMQTAIKSALDTIVDTLIEQYTFNIVSTNTEANLNTVNIDYTIIPIHEIREINNSISVKNRAEK